MFSQVTWNVPSIPRYDTELSRINPATFRWLLMREVHGRLERGDRSRADRLQGDLLVLALLVFERLQSVVGHRVVSFSALVLVKRNVARVT